MHAVCMMVVVPNGWRKFFICCSMFFWRCVCEVVSTEITICCVCVCVWIIRHYGLMDAICARLYLTQQIDEVDIPSSNLYCSEKCSFGRCCRFQV